MWTRTTGACAARCLTLSMSWASVTATFLSIMVVLYESMSQTSRLETKRAGNMEELTGTLSLSSNSMSLSSQRRGHRLRGTLRVSFPVVVETCCDFLSHKTKIERVHFIHSARSPCYLYREQLLELKHSWWFFLYKIIIRPLNVQVYKPSTVLLAKYLLWTT